MPKGKHTPVELTDSAKRKSDKLKLSKMTGKGQARKAANASMSRQDSAAAARRAADKALGITRR